MAIYGIDFYGVGHYGETPFLDFDATPFTAINKDYGYVFLEWKPPTGAWTSLRLVRSTYGYPNSSTDGEILLEQSNTDSNKTYDDFTVQGKRFYYYAIYVYATATSTWVLAATAVVLAAYDYGYSERFFELLPGVFQSASATNITGAETNATLQSFLSIFGFQFDQLRAEYDSLLKVSNPDEIAAGLLPYLAGNLGVTYEPSLGQKQARVYLRNAIHNEKIKGTNPGIATVVSSYTGWGANVAMGYNLMLDYNGSSFEESLGRWTLLSTATGTATLTRGSTTGIAYVDSGFANKQAGYAVVTATSAATTVVLVSATAANIITEGIPVTAGLVYSLSAYFRSAATSRQPTVAIDWYDKDGVFISTSTAGTSSATTTTDWTGYASTVNRTAPAGSYYARVKVTYPTLANGEVQYFDAVQFEQSATASAFQEARDTRITIVADRINEITNPSFEVNTTGWSAGGAATITRSTAQFNDGTASLSITTTTAANDRAETVVSTMKANTAYFVSMRVRPASTFGTLKVTHSGGTTTQAVYTTLTPNVWQTVQLFFTTTTNGNATVAWGNGTVTTASSYFIDSVLLERGNTARAYFDGTTFTATGESLWEGTAHASRSHFYAYRTGRNFRLNQLLPDYTPLGSTFTLLYAQAGT